MKKSNIGFELLQLKQDIHDNKISVKDIVMSTGIDQSQISKILNNKYKTKSENYNKLCKFALNNCIFNLEDLSNDLIKKIKKLNNDEDAVSLLAMYRIVSYLE